MKQILVVCSANICRSPMVAGLLTQRLDAAELGNGIIVRSAGTYAEPGRPAWGPVIEATKKHGVDLDRHRSQPMSMEMVETADLIIAMEEGQRQSIFYLSPRALRKVFLLSELAGGAYPVTDVYGHPPSEVQRMCDLVDTYLEDGWLRIIDLLDLPTTMPNPSVQP